MNAECAAVKKIIFREQIVGLAPDQRLQRDVAGLAPGYADERGNAGRKHEQLANMGLAPLQLEQQREAAVGNEREGVGRVDRLRGQEREDLLAEVGGRARPPTFCRAVHRRRRIRPALGERVAKLACHVSWLSTSRSVSVSIAVNCCAVVMPSAERSSTPERLMRLQPGDADHEEFVEVAGRDRQEAQPLEQADDAGCRLPQARAG